MTQVRQLVDLEGGTLRSFDAPPEVIDVGADLFESEEIIDTAYRAFLSLMVKEWRGWRGGDHFEIPDVGVAYASGVYVCGVRRSIILHQYDPTNDEVPAELALWHDGLTSVLRELPRIPRDYRSAAQGRHFRFVNFKEIKGRADVAACVVTLTADGRIIPAAPTSHGNRQVPVRVASATMLASLAVNLYCDQRHLWRVQTAEKVLRSATTPLTVGVSEEHVKSLFYARELPVTETGRKRPILHWVRAHQRRLREGIDIDVTRHLRGTEAFPMGGFDWRIVNPVKHAAV